MADCVADYFDVVTLVFEELWHAALAENPGLAEQVQTALVDQVALYDSYMATDDR